jgi:hypothetical protein
VSDGRYGRVIADGGVLDWLQGWNLRQCVGDWADRYGVPLDTLDNSGWSLGIDLAETALADRPFTPIEEHRSESDWIVCRLEGEGDDLKWCAYCGPLNLEEVLGAFQAWATKR